MKSNHETATLRDDRPPKSEKVRQAKEVKGAAVKAAAEQNNGNVLPLTKKVESAIAKARGGK